MIVTSIVVETFEYVVVGDRNENKKMEFVSAPVDVDYHHLYCSCIVGVNND